MKLLSVTNTKTQLHKSPTDFSAVCANEYIKKKTVSSDVSFFLSSAASNVFAQIYKGDSIEIWKIKADKDGSENFERIRKTKVDGIQALSCGKNEGALPEYAIGYSTGMIQVYDLNKKNTLKVEFPSEPNNKASVVSIDYSSCGGYLSSVYENGIVNVFGLTTKIKTETIALDRESIIARFHPTKRFHLGVASFQGGVTIYDIQSKRIYFQDAEAHDAPCRDMAMCEMSPDLLFTCGCDSVVKIFDTRKKGHGLQIQSNCGFSTISASKCGGFIAVGNLKGEMTTYDMRALRQPLSKAKLDDELITRVAFLPNDGDNETLVPSLRFSNETSNVSDELPEAPEEPQYDYSMEDLIAFGKGRVSDLDLSCTSRVSAIGGTRISEGLLHAQNMGNALNDLSFSTDVSMVEGSSDLDNRSKSDSTRRSSLKDPSKRRSSFMPAQLQKIREEAGVGKENFSGSLNLVADSISPVSSGGGPRSSSTPFTKSRLSMKDTISQIEASSEVIDVDALDTFEKEEPAPLQVNGRKSATGSFVSPISFIVPRFPPSEPLHNTDFKKEFESLYNKLEEKIHIEVGSLQAKLEEKVHLEVGSLGLDLSMMRFEMLSSITNQRMKLQERIVMIEECMGMLMNDDVKINRVMELQEENKDLRQQLNNVLNRLSLSQQNQQ